MQMNFEVLMWVYFPTKIFSDKNKIDYYLNKIAPTPDPRCNYLVTLHMKPLCMRELKFYLHCTDHIRTL